MCFVNSEAAVFQDNHPWSVSRQVTDPFIENSYYEFGPKVGLDDARTEGPRRGSCLFIVFFLGYIDILQLYAMKASQFYIFLSRTVLEGNES